MSAPQILVIDDDPIVRQVITQGLQGNGFTVLQAATGEQAIDVCAETSIDLAIVDYKMPHLSGLEVAEALRNEYRVPFLFVTAYADDALVRKAVEHGAHGYLVKPVALPDLLRQVEVTLRRSAEAKDLTRALTDTQLINVAIGLLMAKTHTTREQAFTRLRARCRADHLRVLDAAKRIVETFENTVNADDQFSALIDAINLQPNNRSEAGGDDEA